MTPIIRHYSVPSRRDAATKYHVWYGATPGQVHWHCDCPARKRCWHIATAERLFRLGLTGGGPHHPFAIRPFEEEK